MPAPPGAAITALTNPSRVRGMVSAFGLPPRVAQVHWSQP